MLGNLIIIRQYLFQDKESGYILLNSNQLARKLDTFIEMDLNPHIHFNPLTAATALRTLIIQRCYYAHKQGLDIWGSISSIPSEYHQMIESSNLTINEIDISLLLAKYPILKKIEDKHLIKEINHDFLGVLRRKTEFIFGTKTISRLKTYLIFKILTEHEVPPKEAILYALIYRTNLEASEYTIVYNAVIKEEDI